jgi:hypothetical protein
LKNFVLQRTLLSDRSVGGKVEEREAFFNSLLGPVSGSNGCFGQPQHSFQVCGSNGQWSGPGVGCDITNLCQ